MHARAYRPTIHTLILEKSVKPATKLLFREKLFLKKDMSAQ